MIGIGQKLALKLKRSLLRGPCKRAALYLSRISATAASKAFAFTPIHFPEADP